MKPLTKEQALEYSRLTFEYKASHPNATREELEQAFYRLKFTLLHKEK
jgi:hypothetical protein